MKFWIAAVFTIAAIGFIAILIYWSRSTPAAKPVSGPTRQIGGQTVNDFYHPPKPTTTVKGLTTFDPSNTQPTTR